MELRTDSVVRTKDLNGLIRTTVNRLVTNQVVLIVTSVVVKNLGSCVVVAVFRGAAGVHSTTQLFRFMGLMNFLVIRLLTETRRILHFGTVKKLHERVVLTVVTLTTMKVGKIYGYASARRRFITD